MSSVKPRLAVDIIKRGGRRPTEVFMHKKLHTSIRAACLSVRCPKGQAQDIADKVCADVAQWCDNKPTITSADIRRIAARHLGNHHSDAAYIYEYYRKTI